MIARREFFSENRFSEIHFRSSKFEVQTVFGDLLLDSNRDSNFLIMRRLNQTFGLGLLDRTVS